MSKLAPSPKSPCPKFRNGKVVATDGPFAEIKEQVGGVFLIEASGLNEAVRVVSMHPGARLGEHLGWGVEVRTISESCHQ